MLIHFIYVVGSSSKRMNIIQYISIKSFIDNNPNSTVIYHSNKEPLDSAWYWRLKEEPRFKFEKISDNLLDICRDLKITHPVHMSDFIRLNILFEQGGLYTDDDMICLKNLESIFANSYKPIYPAELNLDNEFQSIPNGFMYHPKHHEWTRACINLYNDYDPDKVGEVNGWRWSYRSIQKPTEMYLADKSQIKVISAGIIDPAPWMFTYRRSLFMHDRLRFDDCYTVHLSNSLHKGLFEYIDLEHIMTVNTSFTRVARPFVSHLWNEELRSPKVSLFD